MEVGIGMVIAFVVMFVTIVFAATCWPEDKGDK